MNKVVKERPVGEKFRDSGCTLVVVEDAPGSRHRGCDGCVFRSVDCSALVDLIGACSGGSRMDGKNVHFEEGGE